MVKMIQEMKGLTQVHAYQVASMAADLRITQVVDGNLGVHMMIPKEYVKKP
jgi:acetamidase/formamidase